MGKAVADSVLDGTLDIIATCTEMYICTSEPADRAAAISASLIAAVTLDSGDYAKAAGDASGRKITIAQQANITVTGDGSATHIALCTGTTLLLVTTCDAQSLYTGNTVTVPAFDYECTDPT